MSARTPRAISSFGANRRRTSEGRSTFLLMTCVFGFLVTVATLRRTHVPFNYFGRLDSCLRDLVCSTIELIIRRRSQGNSSILTGMKTSNARIAGITTEGQSPPARMRSRLVERLWQVLWPEVFYNV